MGTMPEGEKTIICKPDSTGQMLVVVVNSIHMIYCQIAFVSFEKSFCTCTSLYSFVTPSDSPPSDVKGKTNLQVDDIEWTHSDAFVLIVFNTGAIAVLPRMGSHFIQIVNPTI
jgi:hypothetical protein